MSVSFTENEHQICTLARMIEEDKIYYVTAGGIPLISTQLAMKTHAPDVAYVLENGTIAPRPSLPLNPLMTMSHSKADYKAAMWSNMNMVGWFAANGLFDYGILSSLQVDQWGNLNSGFLGGDYYHPQRRYGGPGGATEIAGLCWRTIIVTSQQKRKFVTKPDFISSPGFIDGSPDGRERSGMPKGTGPYRVITPMAMFGYDEETHHMKLLAISPWLTVQDVLDEMDFEPLMAEELGTLDPPTESELMILRSEIDTRGQTIGEGKWIEY